MLHDIGENNIPPHVKSRLSQNMSQMQFLSTLGDIWLPYEPNLGFNCLAPEAQLSIKVLDTSGGK